LEMRSYFVGKACSMKSPRSMGVLMPLVKIGS
jgi:hypothetical protein